MEMLKEKSKINKSVELFQKLLMQQMKVMMQQIKKTVLMQQMKVMMQKKKVMLWQMLLMRLELMRIRSLGYLMQLIMEMLIENIRQKLNKV